MKNLIETSYDLGRLKITLEFMQNRELRISHLGKHYPKVTHCTLSVNGIPRSVGSVVKHAYDTDNQGYAFLKAAEKALSYIKGKTIRQDLYREILKQYPINK